MIPKPLRRYLPVLALLALVLAGLFLFPSEPPAPQEVQTPDQPIIPASEYAFMLLKLVAILGGICGLAWLSLRWLLPKFYGSQNPTAARHIQVIEHHRLDPHRGLLLVKVGPETFLLAASERDIRFLARLEHELPPASEPTAGDSGESAASKSPFEVLLRKEP
jgi:flagellar biogenesis protein FliO